MRQIEFTHRYLKDLRLIRRRHLPENELNEVIKKLANDEILDERYHDHKLKGKYSEYRECHIRPDWLLIYKKEDKKQIALLYFNAHGNTFRFVLNFRMRDYFHRFRTFADSY
jgi:mRNA interferase YafQ